MSIEPSDKITAKVEHVPLSEIRPSPENAKLYKPVDADDPAIIELARSIAKHGVQEPLLVTADGWIASGHRRHVAADLAGLDTVPCRVLDMGRDDPQFATLVRECNRQRVKSADETMREIVLDANEGDDPYAALRRHREERFARGTGPLTGRFPILGKLTRKGISRAKGPFVDAIRGIVEDLRKFWPLSARQIHYQLLNNPPLRHASKPGSAYQNDQTSYKSLLDLLTRARLAGHVPMEAVADDTRPVETWPVSRDARTYVSEASREFLLGYWRDLLQGQPRHVELVVEKMTARPIVEPVAAQYTVPMTIGRGYCSLPPRAAMAERYRNSGKDGFALLVVSDFDPDGESIAHSLARSLRDDFGIGQISPAKVALTRKQAKDLGLHGGAEAKRGSATYKKFVKQNGDTVYELEALRPETLQRIVREAIIGALDMDIFRRECEHEEADAKMLAELRRRAITALGGDT